MPVPPPGLLHLTPYSAKRLADLPANIIREYETRFGPLGVETRRPGEAAATNT